MFLKFLVCCQKTLTNAFVFLKSCYPFTATVSCGQTTLLTSKMFILGFCSDQQRWSYCHVCVPSHGFGWFLGFFCCCFPANKVLNIFCLVWCRHGADMEHGAVGNHFLGCLIGSQQGHEVETDLKSSLNEKICYKSCAVTPLSGYREH